MRRFYSILVLFFIISCNTSKKDSKFLITKHQMGVLTDSTAVWQLNQLFPNDSIVVRLEEGAFVEAPDDSYYCYSKTGKLNFVAIVKIQGDSTSFFRKITVFNEKYTTEQGLNAKSYYIDILKSKLKTNCDILPDRTVNLSLDSLRMVYQFNSKTIGEKWIDADKDCSDLQLNDSIQATTFYLNWE